MTACLKCSYDPFATVLRSWEFLIERDPPSLNARLHNAGGRRWAYKRERDEWRSEFRAARVELGMGVALGKRRVTLTRVYGGRQKQRDLDNLSGGMKAVVDAMVLEAVLLDDSPDLAELHYAQHRGELRGLMVLVEELA